MKRNVALLILAGLSALTACGEEFPAALPVITYRGALVMAMDETYPENVDKHNRDMIFRVYDTDVQGADALWESGKMSVAVNPDGSFEATFGDWTLAELITTGTVTHVGLQLGTAPAEITPRRALRPVATATRAIVAEDGTSDMKIGTLETSSVTAKSMSVSLAEISEELVVEKGKINVEPFTLLEGESTRIMRGKGVTVFARGNPQELATKRYDVSSNAVLAKAPADGVALVHYIGSGYNTIPGVIQFCRKDDLIRCPIAASGVKVAFWAFAKEGDKQ